MTCQPLSVQVYTLANSVLQFHCALTIKQIYACSIKYPYINLFLCKFIIKNKIQSAHFVIIFFDLCSSGTIGLLILTLRGWKRYMVKNVSMYQMEKMQSIYINSFPRIRNVYVLIYYSKLLE
jgi:hypothetical protein